MPRGRTPAPKTPVVSRRSVTPSDLPRPPGASDVIETTRPLVRRPVEDVAVQPKTLTEHAMTISYEGAALMCRVAYAAASVAATTDWIGAAKHGASVTRSAVAVYAPAQISEFADSVLGREPLFTEVYGLETRVEMARDVLERDNCTRVPVVLERMNGARIGRARVRKVAAHRKMTVGEFVATIRRKYMTTIEDRDGLVLMTSRDPRPIGPPSETMGDFHARNCDEDQFLYLVYREENVFGG